jgi:hypothetical protein
MTESNEYKFIFYLNRLNKNSCALGMHNMAYAFFNKIYCVTNYQILNKIIADLQKTRNSNPSLLNKLHDFSNESLLDVVKAGICFENFLKGQLMKKGYLIHEIKTPNESSPNYVKLSALKKKQKKEPITIDEYKIVDNFEFDRELKLNTLKGLSEKTINYSLLINNKKYQKILNTDPHILSILERFRFERNTLHMLQSSSWGAEIIYDWERLIKFVNDNIVVEHDKLIINLNYPHSRKIKK